MLRATHLSYLLPLVLFSVGCASQIQWLIPGIAPVTVEKCESLDSQGLGLKDGQEGMVKGHSFKHWQRSCASLKKPLDQQAYNGGYQEGNNKYCHCKKGFVMGAQGKIIDVAPQRSMCQKEQFAEFKRGFKLGEGFSENPDFFTLGRFQEKIYNIEKLEALSESQCN